MFLEIFQSPVFTSPGSNAVSGHYHIPGQLPRALAGFSCLLWIEWFMPWCWEVLLTVCLLSVLAGPVCRAGHICLAHNSLRLDFFFISAGVTCDFYLWHCNLCPVTSVQIWNHALLDNSLLTAKNHPKSSSVSVLEHFSISKCLLPPLLFLQLEAWHHLTPPYFQIITGLGLKASLEKF